MALHLDPKQTDALLAVAEHGSFSKAAAALRLTLAAVSLRVAALEAALGQRLLVRGKRITPTPSGQQVLVHVRAARALEADFLATLHGTPDIAGGRAMQTLRVAVNADSLATWFLPGVRDALKRHRLLLDLVVDDQDYTLEALKQGEVVGCVTSVQAAMPGCVTVPLGTMRYQCVAAPALIDRWRLASGHVSVHRMLRSPAVVFNRKDGLQDLFLKTHFQITHAPYPRHFVPAVDAFECAIAEGLGWGMVPEVSLNTRLTPEACAPIFPAMWVDVPLVWHHWLKASNTTQQLTKAIQRAAADRLRRHLFVS
jgi:LysR family transcriptional regulator (chromosome initiation inhibitor)